MSALWPVQAALFTRLETIPGFAVFAGQADPESSGDHIVVGDSTEQPWHTFGTRGHTATETVHVWVQGGGNVMKARQAVELIRAAVEDAPLLVDGHTVARCRVEFTTTLKDPGWWHVPVRIRITTQVAA